MEIFRSERKGKIPKGVSLTKHTYIYVYVYLHTNLYPDKHTHPRVCGHTAGGTVQAVLSSLVRGSEDRHFLTHVGSEVLAALGIQGIFALIFSTCPWGLPVPGTAPVPWGTPGTSQILFLTFSKGLVALLGGLGAVLPMMPIAPSCLSLQGSALREHKEPAQSRAGPWARL